MFSATPRSHGFAGAGIARALVGGGVEQVGIGGEHSLRAVAVMHVEIDHRDPLHAPPAARMHGGDGGVVEQAEAHRAVRFGVMARRPDSGESGARPAFHDGIDRHDTRRRPRARRPRHCHRSSPYRRPVAPARPNPGGSTGSPRHSACGCTRLSCSTVAIGADSRSRSENSRRLQRGEHGAQAFGRFPDDTARCRAPGTPGG